MTDNNSELKKINFEFKTHETCPICGNKIMLPNGKINWLETDFWYVVCPTCGLKYMNPYPTIESYRNFYKNQFWQQKIRNIGFRQQGQMWQTGRYKWHNDEEWDPEFGIKNVSEHVVKLRIEIISNTLTENIKLDNKAQILEIGCGFPITLENLKEKYGCKVYAIEPSEEARKIIQEKDYIELLGYYAEELEELSKTNKKFDAIIFSHILENTIDPMSIIKFAKSCLKENGIIYIQTPNLLVFDQMNPYHPYIFCHQSLKVLAEKADLKYQQISKDIDRMLTTVLIK